MDLRNAAIVLLAMGMAYSCTFAAQASPPEPSPVETRAAIATYGAALTTLLGEEYALNAAAYQAAGGGAVSAR